MATMSLSKYSPWEVTTFFQRSSHFRKQSLYSDFGIANSRFVAFLFMPTSKSTNLLPLRRFFNLGSGQKSKGARSWLYGEWRSWTMPCFIRNCWISCDECAGLLSWCGTLSSLFHRYGRFLLIARRNRFKTSFAMLLIHRFLLFIDIY